MPAFNVKNLDESDYPEQAQPSAAAMTCNMSDSFFLPHATPMETSFPLPNTAKMAWGLTPGSFPVVTSIVGKMRHRPVPSKLGRSNFRSDMSWEEISEHMIAYFQKRGIRYLPSYATSAFTVTGAPNDSRLQIDIIAYLEESGSFVLEFKRVCGDLFTAADIFADLKKVLHDRIPYVGAEESPDTVLTCPSEGLNSKEMEEYDFYSLLE